MADTVQTIEKDAENAAGKFLGDLISHGEKLVAADLPYDVRKVLGALIHWVGNNGAFVEPDVFNPAVSQQIAQEQANSERLAQENRDLSDRLALLERQFASQAPASSSTTPPSPVPGATPVEGATPVAPDPAPAPAVPVVTAPPEAAASPTPPPSE